MLFWMVKGQNKSQWNFYHFIKRFVKDSRDFSVSNDLYNSITDNDFYAVLDGQQRLTALNIALKGTYAFHTKNSSWDYEQPKTCTLLRSPHIARNEEILLRPYGKEEALRKYYLGHLSDVVMVDSEMYAAERLGGADYDGDMIKTIADPVLNACVQRNYWNLILCKKGAGTLYEIPAPFCYMII